MNIKKLFSFSKKAKIFNLFEKAIETKSNEMLLRALNFTYKEQIDKDYVNYFKRLLRETYRLNQNILREMIENQEEKYSLMFFYQTKERLSFEEINQKTILLFEKFKKSQVVGK